MPELLQYLLKFSIGIAVCACFYQFFLRPLTFYKQNRWYLLLAPLVCLLIPSFNVAPVLSESPLIDSPIIITLPSREIPGDVSVITSNYSPLSFWNIVLLLLLTGIMVRLIVLIIRYRALLSFPKGNLISETDGIRLFDTSEPVSPFSYGNTIIVNARIYTAQELQGIILHETVHIQQKHSWDLLYAEIICAFNWFNPFAWLLRSSIRQNLEFIADNETLKKVDDKSGYKTLLLKAAGLQAHELTNGFNVSLLRLRLVRMNRAQSSRYRLFRLLLILPVIACLLLAFCKPQISTPPVSTNSEPFVPTTTGKSLSPTGSIDAKKPIVEKTTVIKAENRPAKEGYYIISAVSTKDEVKKLKQILSSFDYELTIEQESYDGDKLVEFSGVLSGKPFDDDLTHSMRFNIVAGGLDKIGCHTGNGRLYAMTTNTSRTSRTE